MANKISLFSFLTFISLAIIGSSNYLLVKLTGIDLNVVVGVSILFSCIIFLFGSTFAISFSNASKKKLSFPTFAIILYSAGILIYGILIGNEIGIIIEEAWIGIVIFLAYKLSLNQAIWNAYKKHIFLIFLLISLIIYKGLDQTREYIDEIDVAQSVLEEATASLGYELISLLDFWPFIFALLFFRGGYVNKVLAIIPFIIYISLQLYFLKRAPTVRAFIQVFFFFWIASIKNNKLKSTVYFVPIIAIGLILFYLVIPEQLVERFSSDDGSRPDELINMFSQMNPVELVFGKGLGGEYISDNGIYDYLSPDAREMRTTVHIGAAYPILKGGLLLFSLIFSHLIILLIKSFKHVRAFSDKEIASFGFLVIFLVFRFVEGPMNSTSIFNAIMFGMSIGWLENFVKLKSAKISA
jgi:hypothetical protein